MQIVVLFYVNYEYKMYQTINIPPDDDIYDKHQGKHKSSYCTHKKVFRVLLCGFPIIVMVILLYFLIITFVKYTVNIQLLPTSTNGSYINHM